MPLACCTIRNRDGKRKPALLAAGFPEPSDGLEPSTPSLPSSDEAGSAGTTETSRARKSSKEKERPKTTDRACPS